MQNSKLHFGIVWLLTCFFLVFPCTGKSRFIYNTLEGIRNCENRVKLIRAGEWGGDNEEDEQKFFRDPTDIVISRDGDVFICDSGNHRIQVFDRTGTYKLTIGGRGKGPGDLLNPCSIALDGRGNLVVADYSNSRIQFLTTGGTYLDSFKITGGRPSIVAVFEGRAIAVHSHRHSYTSGILIRSYDFQGKVINQIGNPNGEAESLANSESIFFSLGPGLAVTIAFYATPFFCRYSPTGELQETVAFDMPFPVPRVQSADSGAKVRVSGEKKEQVVAGVAVDRRDRTYLVVRKRRKTEKERRRSQLSYITGRDGVMHRVVSPFDSEYTDLFRLLVFGKSGRILAACQLNVYCNRVYVHDNHLFIIDSFKAMRIYEYKICFTSNQGKHQSPGE